MWLVVNCKNGVSSYEIHRAIGVTQKTAWFMDHRIRLALNMGSFDKLSAARTLPPRSRMPMTTVLSLPPVPVIRRLRFSMCMFRALPPMKVS